MWFTRSPANRSEAGHDNGCVGELLPRKPEKTRENQRKPEKTRENQRKPDYVLFADQLDTIPV
jgi:hypothetical protein